MVVQSSILVEVAAGWNDYTRVAVVVVHRTRRLGSAGGQVSQRGYRYRPGIDQVGRKLVEVWDKNRQKGYSRGGEQESVSMVVLRAGPCQGVLVVEYLPKIYWKVTVQRQYLIVLEY